MKRYLIFGTLGPFVSGFLLLIVTTEQSGYWADKGVADAGKFLVFFLKTLQYTYLFGLVPALMVGAVDDILFHVRRLAPALRIALVGLVGFAAAVLYSARGPGIGWFPYVLYGLVGLVPATLSSWLSHRYADESQAVKA